MKNDSLSMDADMSEEKLLEKNKQYNRQMESRKVLKYNIKNNCYHYTLKGMFSMFYKLILLHRKERASKRANQQVVKFDTAYDTISVSLIYMLLFFYIGIIAESLMLFIRGGFGSIYEELAVDILTIGTAICIILICIYKKDLKRNK